MRRYFSFLKTSMLTILNMKTSLLGLIFNCLLATVLVVISKIFDINIFDYFVRNISLEIIIKVVFFIIALLLFAGVSALMQSIIVDRDSKVFEVISVNMSENHYIIGKIISAVLLVFVSFVNQILSLVYMWGLNAILYGNSVTSKIDFNVSVWSLLSSILLIILSVILSSFLVLSISIKVNNINEASGTALVVLTPYIVSLIVILFLPNNIEELSRVSELLLCIPLITPIFLLLNIFVNGFSIIQIVAIFYIILQIVAMYFITHKIYRTAYYNNNSYKLLELFNLIFVKEKKYARNK
ncbi:hypothetical protein AB3329_00875 [Streptococcus sp. H31]|uniref:hypothetical protein n=1 Tax=Streptococcus huangxiaojuni TaxID=3237239 RepID=UPI0034A5B1D8